MVRDFTLKIYERLCLNLKKSGFRPIGVGDYLANSANMGEKVAIIRHDVDRLPLQALKMAEIENDLGIKSTYYFRSISKVFKKDIIKSVKNLGHEIGYHYEVLANNDGNKEKALAEFQINLEMFRQFADIRTICMHGSPLSPWRDFDIWKKYDFKDFGIIGEAFLSIDYNNVMYFTDTGRKWNNQSSNVRDIVSSNIESISVNSTRNLIENLVGLDMNISINTHPHRWHDSYLRWQWELIFQNIKNIGKKFIKKRV